MWYRDLAVGSRKVICRVVKGSSWVMEVKRKKVDREKKKETNDRVDVFIRKVRKERQGRETRKWPYGWDSNVSRPW